MSEVQARTVDGHVYVLAADVTAAFRRQAEQFAQVGEEQAAVALRSQADELDFAVVAHATTMPGDSTIMRAEARDLRRTVTALARRMRRQDREVRRLLRKGRRVLRELRLDSGES